MLVSVPNLYTQSLYCLTIIEPKFWFKNVIIWKEWIEYLFIILNIYKGIKCNLISLFQCLFEIYGFNNNCGTLNVYKEI